MSTKKPENAFRPRTIASPEHDRVFRLAMDRLARGEGLKTVVRALRRDYREIKTLHQ